MSYANKEARKQMTEGIEQSYQEKNQNDWRKWNLQVLGNTGSG